VVSFANKLRQVVAANFVEISRPDTSESKNPPKPNEALPAITPPAAEVEAPVISDAVPLDELPSANDTLSASSDFVTDEPVAALASEGDAAAVEAEAGSASSSDDLPSDPMALIGDTGGVEFNQVFARASVPAAASFTAEQALSMLHSMPSDLPLRVKRLTVKATLDAVGQAVGATPKDIVNDAERKVTALEAFIREVSERAQELRIAEDAEIESLRARIAEREAQKVALSQQENAVFSSCRSKIEDLDQVIAFFTTGESDEAISAQTDDPDESEDAGELPAYLQEDAVKRLLGLHGASEEEDAEPVSVEAEPDVVGARSRGTRSRR
jgi:hypothetical protein